MKVWKYHRKALKKQHNHSNQRKGINPGEFMSQIKKKNYNAKKLEELTLKYASRIDQLKNSRIESEIIADHKAIQGKNQEDDSLTDNTSSEKPSSKFANKGKDKSNIDNKSGKIPPEKQKDLSPWENWTFPVKEKDKEKDSKKSPEDNKSKFANKNNDLDLPEKEDGEESLEKSEAEDEVNIFPGKDKAIDKGKKTEKKIEKEEAQDKLEKKDKLSRNKNDTEEVEDKEKDKDKEKEKDNPSVTNKEKENTNYQKKYDKQNNSSNNKSLNKRNDLNNEKDLEETNEDNKKQQDDNNQIPDGLDDSNEEIRRSKASEKMPESIRAMLREFFTNKKWK